ncbi:MAG: glutathionylspermidine synthase family protein [Ruminococcus sp.]|jgi:glutathionylspermidine synthase
MKTIADEYRREIREHFEENRKAALEIKNYLEHSSVAYHGRCVHTLHVPKVFTPEVIKHYEQIVETTYSIFIKVIQEYLKNPSYRKLFPFSKQLEELILIPNLYQSFLPIARFDIFYNEESGSFKFCEINTDGTSAMNEDYVLNMAVKLNPAHQAMEKRYKMKSFELFDSWVKTFMEIYGTYEKKKERPYVAIVDFLEHCSITEFEEFKRRFEAAGYETEICEITELKYRDHVLYSPSGHTVDVIYRRAVTSDIMTHYNEVKDFLDAVKHQDVCIIGSFCTQIIHNKWLFYVLHRQETLDFLTEEEQKFVKAHVPDTDLLTDSQETLEHVRTNKNTYIIKPLDSYASRGVYAGIDFSEEEWENIVKEHAGRDYIYQEYCPPYRTENIYLVDKEPVWKNYTNMSGLFVYNGKFSGIYSRLSDGGIISSQYNEKAVATMYAEL